MLLIAERRGDREKRTKEEGHALYERMLAFARDLKSRGLLLGAESLASDSEGARVRMKDGRRTVMDGPFVEAKEMIGGFFLLACETKDEAIAIAAECPAAQWASVEVRRIAPCFE